MLSMREKRKRPYSYRGRRVPRWLTALAAAAAAGAVAFGVLLGAVLLGAHDQIQGSPGAMIVLGCQVMPGGEPSILLRDRLDTALDYWQEHPEILIVASGGQGGNEPTSEARAMADYLMEGGVPGEQILLEDQSHNTNQNLRYSIQLLHERGYDTTSDIAVVSNGFHLARVRMLWSRVSGGDYNLSTLAAPASHLPSRLSMYIREPLALVKSFLLDR